MILAIDPGSLESAYVVLDGDQPRCFGKVDNHELLSLMADHPSLLSCDRCAIELIGHYGTGMPAGREVFDACIWIGRFAEAWAQRGMGETELILRKTVCAHICGSARAKDGNIRQALIDRYGGKDKAIGKKKQPGPLYGISADVWQALAVGLSALDTHLPAKETA